MLHGMFFRNVYIFFSVIVTYQNIFIVASAGGNFKCNFKMKYEIRWTWTATDNWLELCYFSQFSCMQIDSWHQKNWWNWKLYKSIDIHWNYEDSYIKPQYHTILFLAFLVQPLKVCARKNPPNSFYLIWVMNVIR